MVKKAMKKRRLTDVAVERLPLPRQGREEVIDALVPGLALRLGSRTRSWVLYYRVWGETPNPKTGRRPLRRLTLGRWPQLKVGEARDAARDALKLADAGDDPAVAKRQALADRKAAKADTVEAVVDEFMNRYRKKRNAEDTVKNARSVFDRLVLPAWRDRPISDIRRKDVIRLLDDVAEDRPDRPHAPNKVLKEVRRLFNWAVERDLVPASPASGIPLPVPELSRDRVLTDDELKSVWEACDELGYPFGPAIRLLILTAQRRDEVGGMRWPDVSDDTWTLPSDATKSKRSHSVPLSPTAVDLIEELPHWKGPYVFSMRGGRRPISGWSKIKKRLDEKSKVTGWRLHDLRRTAASGMARIGVAPHVLAHVLNHSPRSLQGVTAIYNRHGYENEKRQALEAWANALKLILEDRQDRKVVALR